MQHILLCRVILGNVELLHSGSQQSHPSSEKFDSGVDDLENPSHYIIWHMNMNTHIYPEYVVSFRMPPVNKGTFVFWFRVLATESYSSGPAVLSALGSPLCYLDYLS